MSAEIVKAQVAHAVQAAMEAAIRDRVRCDRAEVTIVSPLVTQVKVWPVGQGAPRYFTVKVAEQL